ncbi:hypothetical protein D3C83_130990 [compost metagenome]
MPRSGPGPSTFLPSSVTVPELRDSSPARMRISVDLPQPDGPITQTNSRRCTLKLISFNAVTVSLPDLG